MIYTLTIASRENPKNKAETSIAFGWGNWQVGEVVEIIENLLPDLVAQLKFKNEEKRVKA